MTGKHFTDYINGKLVNLLIFCWNNFVEQHRPRVSIFHFVHISHSMVLFTMLKSSWRLFSSPILTDYVKMLNDLFVWRKMQVKIADEKFCSEICRLKWLHLPIWTGWSSATTMLICWRKQTSRNHSAQWVYSMIFLTIFLPSTLNDDPYLSPRSLNHND